MLVPVGPFQSVAETAKQLESQGYVADDSLVIALFLAVKLGRPLFLEGAPGVGKTELAKVVARLADTDLIRLQCHEGLDLSQAAYEWNYPRQLLELQGRGPTALHPRATGSQGQGSRGLFVEEYLLKRPLLSAIDPAREKAPVLLIDELDRADEEFESFLLELLSDFQITIPELGTIRARHRPLVFLTSNRTREVHDALKRRCLYHWIDYPSLEKEIAIVRRRVPGAGEALSRQVVAFVQGLRRVDLYKLPGVAETIDWAQALAELGVQSLEAGSVDLTLGCLLKYRDDIERVKGSLSNELLGAVTAA
jgi:MoxR-like ATPase